MDIPGSAATSTTVTVGSSTINTLETVGDHDWFRVNLVDGQAITVLLSGVTLDDPYLRIRDSAGNIVYENDDIHLGVELDSKISFEATYTGVYYIDVGSWNDAGTGDYQLNVTAFQTPPVFSNDQIAEQLASGYWGDGEHPFNVTSGGSLTVNLTALNTAGLALARAALQSWSQITGINFVETSGAAQITFDDAEEGAFTESTTDPQTGFATSAHVNVHTSWLQIYTPDIGGYAYQAYLHEIGHALGLGHAGNYNNTANYPYDAVYSNDAWSTSIMSYFSQDESTYFNNQNFTNLYLVTPMVADILAMQQLYGLSTTTRSGDTTYGFNTNAGTLYDASATTNYRNFALTIFDTGGTDTFDFSGYNFNQTINLNPESFSNIAGRIGNLSIARGSIIENAIGGTMRDTIIGNSVANILTGGEGQDNLTGGAGNDIFRDTAAGLNGDTITDFTFGDRIVISDRTLSGFNFGLNGATLTYTGGSITLGGGVAGTITASAAVGGGVQLTLSAMLHAAIGNAGDFNGDGRDDVFWRHDDGRVTNWLGTASGGFSDNVANAYNGVALDWQIVGFGDFNGDNRSDVLWRNTDGRVTNWLGGANGGITSNAANSLNSVSVDWQIAAIGDFNGDNREDILWRNVDGRITDWLGTQSGGFADNVANAYNSVSTDWRVIGAGDFNGDNRDDILWRNTDGRITNWLGNGSGGFTSNAGNSLNGVSLDWQVVGIGDFNGDGRDDIMWRHADGRITNWLGTASGGYADNVANAYNSVSLDWQVASIGDFNGDGRDDILWRNTDGRITDWLSTANGGYASNAANSLNTVATQWHVQPDHLWAA